ncbi:hypothetical protein EOT10_00675 [Streptomyces antnestii]|uniref:Uncharacterized protein n=1 Tax=Streptomyces antnestii TaxID=2494256 RepID=A0A437Q1W0_9ACTN|nr:hypothetical protein [Streptomyces sp. San01]RVU28443.1 hypothetical protein EOT10_00675 [Streptomyces sp. San01]
MSQEAVPEQVVHEPPVPQQQGAPKGLLQQMEELMAALNADLSQLDADLQQSTGPQQPTGQHGPIGPHAPAGPHSPIGQHTPAAPSHGEGHRL